MTTVTTFQWLAGYSTLIIYLNQRLFEELLEHQVVN
jgi:hypothetical protein